MRKVYVLRRKLIVFAVALLWCATAYAQQQPPQTLTFYYGYTVKPGKEEDFVNLVKTVGAPVRDKLIADGVINAWGVETPLLRSPGGRTHYIWFNVNDWAGVKKVMAGMAEQIARLDAEAAAPAKNSAAPVNRPALRKLIEMLIAHAKEVVRLSKLPPASNRLQ